MSTKLWNITNMIQEVKANNYTFYGVSLQAYPAHNYSFYYDFYNYPTLQVTYAVNNAPLLNLNSPTANTLYSEVNTSVSPSIVVSDIDNQTLTAKYYVDVEVTPRDTKTLTSTVTAQVVTFNPFNPSTLTDGNHTIKYTLTDGYVTTQQTVNIKVDKTAPAISTFSVTTTDTSINITTLATDAVAGLDPNPYRYTVDASISSWGSSTTYSKNSLTPNTTYAAKVEARDTKGHISNLTSNIYTKAQVPVLSINNPTAISLDITTTDNNPSSTLYQFISGTKYVQANGTLTTTPTWISLTAKKVTVTGLTPTTTYTFQAKAKNVSGVETALSIGAVGATFQDVPPVPTNFQASATSNIVTLSWNSVLGATSYDVEVNGVIINNNTSITYQHTQLNPATTHQYRVRAKNTVGVGNWSAMYPITTGYSVYTVTRSLNQTFNLVLSATKINNFGQHTFTVSYDPLAFDVVDLSTLTWPKELSLGTITGTGIAITQFSPGSITFTVSNAITMGNSWSGVANIIKFRAKANITSNITYIMN
jgi:chitodextrinase